MADVNALIARIEDFYEVWSDGFEGEPKDVSQRLCRYSLKSIQAAKKVMSNPTRLVIPLSHEQAVLEMDGISQTGLKCKLVHVGRRRLDEVSEEKIQERLSRSGEVEISNVFVDPAAKRVVHIDEYGVIQEHPFDMYSDNEYQNEREYILYLACLRYLLLRNRIHPAA